MTNFVDDNTDIPGPKVEWVGTVDGLGAPHPDQTEDPTMWCRVADYNTMRQACYDMRAKIIALSGGGGAAPMFDLEVTATSPITFGPAVSPFDPGVDYGVVTLLHVVTDGSSRSVNGLAIRNAVHGTVVALKNDAGSAAPNYQDHGIGGDGAFGNAGLAPVTGGSHGVVWYRLNANVSPKIWENIAATVAA